MNDVTADQLNRDMCGWQTEYGTGAERYCAQAAGTDVWCPAHARMAADHY